MHMLPIKITIYGTKGQCLCRSLFVARRNATIVNDVNVLAFVPVLTMVAVTAKRLPQIVEKAVFVQV